MHAVDRPKGIVPVLKSLCLGSRMDFACQLRFLHGKRMAVVAVMDQDRASPDVRAKAFGRALPRRLGYVLDDGDKAVAVDKRSDAYPVVLKDVKSNSWILLQTHGRPIESLGFQLSPFRIKI